MRADRLLRMTWILSGRTAPVPAARLAALLEVSPRTVLRDVEALSAAGVPVDAERGSRGGIALIDGYRPDVLGLDEDEARALSAVASLPAAGALGLADLVRSAIDKVRRAADRGEDGPLLAARGPAGGSGSVPGAVPVHVRRLGGRLNGVNGGSRPAVRRSGLVSHRWRRPGQYSLLPARSHG